MSKWDQYIVPDNKWSKFQVSDDSLKGGANSPALVKSREEVSKAQKDTSIPSILKKTSESLQPKELPFTGLEKPSDFVNPRKVIGETAKAASILPISAPLSGALYMGGRALEKGSNLPGMAGSATLGAVGGKVAEKVLPAVGSVIKKSGETIGKIPIGKTGVNVGDVVGKYTEPVLKNVEDKVGRLYNYAIGAKSKNLSEINRMMPNRVNAIKAIHENIPNLKFENQETGQLESRAPQNRLELSQALRQTKQQIWNKYNQLSKGATQEGARINLPDLAEKALNETKKQIGSVALKTDPTLMSRLDESLTRVKLSGNVTPTEAEEFMKYLQQAKNQDPTIDYTVKEFYKNLQSKLNEETDNVIEKTLNQSGYKDLRSQYAALKSAEKEILNSANRYYRQVSGKTQGIEHPFVNLWSLEDAMRGVGKAAMGDIHGGISDITRGALIKGSAALTDHMKSPDRRITEMFNVLDTLPKPSTSVIKNIEGTNLGDIGKASMSLPVSGAIDMNKIGQMESSNNPNAVSNKGAIGIDQITKPALMDYNKAHKTNYNMNDMKKAELNKKIGDWYMNVRIPRMLKASGIPDTKENRLSAYNNGIGNLSRQIRGHKNKPKETRNYIKRYES